MRWAKMVAPLFIAAVPVVSSLPIKYTFAVVLLFIAIGVVAHEIPLEATGRPNANDAFASMNDVPVEL